MQYEAEVVFPSDVQLFEDYTTELQQSLAVSGRVQAGLISGLAGS